MRLSFWAWSDFSCSRCVLCWSALSNVLMEEGDLVPAMGVESRELGGGMEVMRRHGLERRWERF